MLPARVAVSAAEREKARAVARVLPTSSTGPVAEGKVRSSSISKRGRWPRFRAFARRGTQRETRNSESVLGNRLRQKSGIAGTPQYGLSLTRYSRLCD